MRESQSGAIRWTYRASQSIALHIRVGTIEYTLGLT